jgi:hypothetical protein
MVFVLYKVSHKDSSICITEVFENEADAKDKMKLLTDQKTPEESLEESFSIQESFYTRTDQYNFKEPPFRYSEEDNNIDETDLESTTRSLRKRKNEITKRIVVKTIKVEYDYTELYLYLYLCFIMFLYINITILFNIY